MSQPYKRGGFLIGFVVVAQDLQLEFLKGGNIGDYIWDYYRVQGLRSKLLKWGLYRGIYRGLLLGLLRGVLGVQTMAYMSYGLKLGWGRPMGGCIGGLGGNFQEYTITLVRGSCIGFRRNIGWCICLVSTLGDQNHSNMASASKCTFQTAFEHLQMAPHSNPQPLKPRTLNP